MVGACGQFHFFLEDFGVQTHNAAGFSFLI
jgi:hypothetical protein